MTSLLVNPDRLESFRQVLARPSERRQTRAEIAQLKQSLLLGTDLDYERDIKPWLGDELTLAITTLDLDRDPANGRQPGYLAILTTNDPERSREFLQLFWQKRAIAGTDLIFEPYAGVRLIYGSPAVETEGARQKAKSQGVMLSPAALLASESLASAAVGDRYVLFANHPKVLRDALNNVQVPDLNLSNAEFYQQSLESLTQPRVGITFVNLPGLAGWLRESGTVTASVKQTAATDAATEQTAQPGIQTLAIGLGLERQGLVANTALQSPDRQNSTPASLTKPVAALQHIPATAPIVAAGTDLEHFWQGLLDNLAGYDAVSQLINQSLATLEQRWQLDLNQDVFSWVKGDYALALMPKVPIAPQRKANSRAAIAPLLNDWIFVAQKSDEAAQQGIAHLDDLARQQGLSVGTLTLRNQSVSAWTRLTTGNVIKTPNQRLQAEVQGVHAPIGNYEIFATSIAAMDAALEASETIALLDNDRFQQAIAPLRQPNHGYLYLDWLNSRRILEQQVPLVKVLELAFSPLFRHLRSLTISSYGSDSGVQQSGLFVRLN
jgi:hypothetical protein